MLTELHRRVGGPYTSSPALPSRYLSTGAIGPGCREIGRKNKKGKKLGESKQHPRARLQLCICLACFASRLSVLPLLPSPSLPFPSSAQARSKTFAHRTLPRCQLFPPRVLSLAFSLSPGFHSSLSSSVRSRSAIARVGSLLLFFVPRAVTSTPPASPRLAAVVLSSCPALLLPARQCLASSMPGKSC